jgi:hypothetical protein
MSDESKAEKKIIIDEDWKTQVQEEKERLKQGPEDAESPAAAQAEATEGELPPASFAFLVTSLATQAMAALGQLPDPIEHKPVVHLELARHHIDTLSVLQEKTKGNLADEEARMLEEVLHQMRMLFVAVQQQPDAAAN